MVLNTEWSQVEVIDLINDGTGLAFGIIGGRSTGVVVKTILPGGVADRDGRLQSGDHILQIGEVNLRGLGSEQVASVLRQCGVHVRMVVARPIESANAEFQTLTSLAPIVPTKILGDPVELDKHLIENGYGEAFAFHSSPSAFDADSFIYTGHNDIRIQGMLGPPLQSYVTRAVIQNSLKEDPPPDTETLVVELTKDDLGLGITVAGYVCEKEEISGIFVKSISKGSAADSTQNIQINDRIVQVNGTTVLGLTNHRAVEVLRNAGPTVALKLERYLRGPKYEQLQQAIRANELRPLSPASPTLTSLPKVPLSLVQMDYLGIEPDVESRTSFEFDSAILLEAITPANEEKEIVIGGERKFVQFSVESCEKIYAEWRGRLDESIEIVIAQMAKDYGTGLGISLEGTVDVEDGKEVRPHHYIRNILPDGPVGRNNILQSGDELLEVNGVQLLGLNHLEVVSILKQLPNFVSITCARYPVPISIIDTSQHIEAFQARKIFVGSLQTIDSLNENKHLVKAKSESSIASSVASGAGSRSRSLELIAGLPMWCENRTVVELVKGDHGLGFSILDYQDPFDQQETLIVIRSLVPGGVAQNDGRLIPGDRLLAVNDVDLEHSTLDQAVQTLKGVPKGVVKISVAKPLSGLDAVSNDSKFVRKLIQEWSEELAFLILDTEEDQTCLEDFQECIEEFQECLDAVYICMEDDNYFFNYSPCTSQVEDFGQKRNGIANNHLNVDMKLRDSIGDSDIDISFKSMNEGERIAAVVTQNDKPSDGYETCMEESLSEDNKYVETIIQFHETDNQRVQNHTKIESKLDINDVDDITPTNSKVNLLSQIFLIVPGANTDCYDKTVNSAVSEPCLHKDLDLMHRRIFLDSKTDDGLKSYDNRPGEHGDDDEFFLIEYPSTESSKEVCKSVSEPNVLEGWDNPRPRIYKKCLKEYYNDYADCLEAYNSNLGLARDDAKISVEEMSDDDIFSDIPLPFKSRSTPDIMDSSFVTLTYDPGPDVNRRKSAFVLGYRQLDDRYNMNDEDERYKDTRLKKILSNLSNYYWMMSPKNVWATFDLSN